MSGQWARPNGKIYKPRKPPRAYEVDNSDGDYREPSMYIYVLGTHDVERAHALALRLNRAADKSTAEIQWIRQVMRDGERAFDFDPVRGAAAVEFGVIE